MLTMGVESAALKSCSLLSELLKIRFLFLQLFCGSSFLLKTVMILSFCGISDLSFLIRRSITF